MGLSSGIPLSVKVTLKSAWRLAMARNHEGLRDIKICLRKKTKRSKGSDIEQ